MELQSVIFDFAFTLCSQKYFHRLGRQWEQKVDDLLFGPESHDLWAGPWMQGRRSSSEVCEYLSAHLPFTAKQLAEALESSCRALEFNPAVEALARHLQANDVPTALVTVNMDCFTELVCPHHRLAELFGVVINSADYDSLDKRDLWPLAFEALGGPTAYVGSWLIDDSVRNVEAFRQLGGRAILYVDDPHFRQQLARNGFVWQEPPNDFPPGSAG